MLILYSNYRTRINLENGETIQKDRVSLPFINKKESYKCNAQKLYDVIPVYDKDIQRSN